MNTRLYRCLALLVLLGVGMTLSGTADGKKAVALDDLKLWRESAVTLSPDGKWITVLYSPTEKPRPEEGSEPKAKAEEAGKTDPEKERRQRDTALYGERALTDVLYIRAVDGTKEYGVERGAKPIFSSDSQWLACTIRPKEEGKEQKETPSTVELRHLASGKVWSWQTNATPRFCENLPWFVTFDKSELLLFHLESRREHFIAGVGEYLLDKQAQVLLYTIEAKEKRGNGIYLFDLKSWTTRPFDNAACHYGNIGWNFDHTGVSAVKYQKTKEGEPSEIRLLLCRDIFGAKPLIREYALADIKGIPTDLRPDVEAASANERIPAWSRDNRRLFIRLRRVVPAAKKEESARSKAEPATVDVWHGKDAKLVSQQMMESKEEAKKTFLAVFTPETRTVVPLTGSDMQTITWAPDTDRWAIGGDDRALLSDWDIPKLDLYRIDLQNGVRTLIEKAYAGEVILAPTGDKLLLWLDKQYWLYDCRTDTRRRLATPAGLSFRDEEYDQFGADPDYGVVGWSRDGQAVIVYHRYDIWQLACDGRTPAVNLTGRLRGERPLRFRFCETDFFNKPDEEERTIDPAKPYYLTAFDTRTKEAGYCRLQRGTVTPLLAPAAVTLTAGGWRRPNDLLWAKKGNAVVFRRGNYQEYPEAWLADSDFRAPRRLTTTNPQQSGYLWGRRILVEYRNKAGIPLQGVLSIPEGYRQGERRPMIVYSYEKLSQGLFQYPAMRISGSGVAEMLYVSDGYLFLQPDIHFGIGRPHSDMLECIEAAIAEVARLGYVDEKRIGYEGFSFGGHCGMFMATRSTRFAAIAAGAGVSNLIEGFTVDIVGDGSNEQDYYMTQQGRLGADPTADLVMYVRESAVMQARKLSTPLLLFHGTADKVVQWEHSFGLYSILRFLKKPVILLSYKGEGHGLQKPANRLDIQQRLKEFFDHYLQGRPAPAWISEGQPFRPASASGSEKEKEGQGLEPWK